MKIYVGCDLGGTNIKAGLVNIEDGHVLISDSIPTLARQGSEAVLERMAEHITDLINQSGVDKDTIGGVGISAPGMIDLDTNTTEFLPNLYSEWRGVPVGERMQSYLNLDIDMLNDVRAITYGEWAFGAGRGVDSMACFAIGTGVGGGLVVNNRLVLGIGGTAGELGHQTVDLNGPICGCGNRGCIEVFASGPAIAAEAARGVRQGWNTKIADLIDHDLNQLTAEVVAQAAEMGDEFAIEVWNRAGSYLGIGVANILTSVGVKRVVIGGGVAKAGEFLLEPIRREVQKRVFLVPVEKVEILPAKLGTDAGIVGMAAWSAGKHGETIHA
ncbi:MAG: ROK family protein [Anaerolineaceae bacterium]|jgi:glucokinase|nr:ROK family protein [Anaerolineaceae bacterium]